MAAESLPDAVASLLECPRVPNAPTEACFLGMTTRAYPGWEDYFAEPVGRKGTTDPEKIARQIAEKRAEQAAAANNMPVAACVHSAAILNLAGETIWHYEQAFPPARGGMLVMYAFQRCLELAPAKPVGLWDVNVRLFGLNIGRNLQIAAMSTLADPESLLDAEMPNARVPVGLWYRRTFDAAPYLDPYHVLLPSATERAQVPLELLCRRLGVRLPEDFRKDAVKQAEVARRLTVAAQLLPE